MTPTDKTLIRALSLAEPPEQLLPSEWASRYMVLGRGASAKAGRLVPYGWQIEPLNSLVDPLLNSTTLLWASQVASKSTILNAAIGYIISQKPSPIIMLQPSVEMAQVYSKSRLSPLFLDTPLLKQLVIEEPESSKYRRRGLGDQTVLLRRFPGGWIGLFGANSSAGLRSHAARYVFADEVSSFPVSAGEGEGDPLSLALRRSETYGPDAFTFYTSTPGIVGQCAITDRYELTDKREWRIRCERCSQEFMLRWEHVKWDKSQPNKAGKCKHLIETAFVECPACQAKFSDEQRRDMAVKGRWVKTAPEVTANAGFMLNALVAQGPPKRGYKTRLEAWAAEFLEAHKRGSQFQRAFQTTVLSEPFNIENEGESLPAEDIYNRRVHNEEVNGEVVVPEAGMVMVAGVDVQANRIEVNICAAGEHGSMFGVSYRVIKGDVEQRGIWEELDALLSKRWRHSLGGRMHVECCAIDVGYKGDACYRYVRSCRGRKVYGIRGSRGWAATGAAWITRSTQNQDSLYLLKTDSTKQSIFDRLLITDPEATGYQTFPANLSCGFDREFFRQLCESETLQSKRAGTGKFYVAKQGVRNEALDTFVYVNAALSLIPNIDWESVKLNLANRPFGDWRLTDTAVTTTAVNEAASEPSDLNDALAHLDMVLEKINLK